MLTAAVQPSIFSDLVDKFTNQQRKLVIEIGFGGLLMIHLKRIGRKMNSWLIECFNTESRMFVIGDLKEFVVSSNVVHDILALPRNANNKVPEYSIYRKCDNDFSPAKDWWTRYIGDLHEAMNLFQKDFDAIYDVHVKRLLSLKSKVEESFSSQNATAATTSSSPIIFDSQDFFSSPEVLEYIDRVVDSIATVKKVTSDMPSFTLLTPSPPQQKEVEERGNGDKEDDEEGDDEESEDEDFDDEDLERSEDSDEENDREEENQEVEMAGDPNDGKSDDDDDSSDIGDLLLVSNFTRLNAKLFTSNLDPYMLDMVDFCLYEDSDKPNNSETIVLYGADYDIARDEFLTLRNKEQINILIVECYSIRLNNIERSNDGPRKRFFFGLHHMDALEKIVSSGDKYDPK